MANTPSQTSNKHQSLQLFDFLITQRWRPSHPDHIQAYTFGTPNGVKIPIALEELGLCYEVHRVPLNDEGVKSPEFLSLNPNNKIPAIIDPEGPDGPPIGLFESGAILVYLAEKTGRLFGSNQSQRYEILQWLMFQIGGVGPMFGQFGYFYAFNGKEIEDPRPLERYLNETKRLLNVIDKQLEGRMWLVDDYSIADIAIGPWLETIERFYKAGAATKYRRFTQVVNYVNRFKDRSAVVKGWSVLSAE